MTFDVIDYVNTTLPDYYPEPFVWYFWQYADTYEFGGKAAIFYSTLDDLKYMTHG
jgi:hypothetical protein